MGKYEDQEELRQWDGKFKKEYLDKDVFLENLNKMLDYTEKHYQELNAHNTLLQVVDMVVGMKTANVKQRKQGKWNKSICSCCNSSYLDYVTAFAEMDGEPNFCPNCGAEMSVKPKDGLRY